MSGLTQPQMRALAFIRDFKITKSEWLKNGKSASGHPKTWTHARWSGPEGSITLTAADQAAIRPFFASGRHPDGSMYGLSDAGRKALESAS